MVKYHVDRFRAEPGIEWVGIAGSASPAPTLHYANGTQELLVSEGHNYRRIGKSKGDIGGPFHCLRRELEERNFGPVHNRTVLNPSNAGSYNYRGMYYAAEESVSDTDFPVPPIAPNNELDVLGTRAIRNTIPTNPLAGAAVALGELRQEGIPALYGAVALKEKVGRARAAGSEYLNHEFGWKPILDEVSAISDAIFHSDHILRKYEAESGKLLHRKYTFPTDISSSESVAGGTYPLPTIKVGYWTGSGTTRTVTTTRVRRWFSGAFTYHLAPQGSLVRKEQLLYKRLGTRVNPEVLWNLTPWTWAADWIFNLGDIIHNVSAFANDGLVMPYAYVMKETQITKVVHHQGARMKYPAGAPTVDCSQTFRTTRKQRRKATPFGFGLNPDTFTDRQWAILVALGLSRGHKQAAHG